VSDDTADFEEERRRLFGIAYRMLGVVHDAEDIVQEAWIRLRSTPDVETPAAFLTTVTTRLAIDRLRAAQRSRETYVGPWLPEPIITDQDPAHVVELDESVTLGFLHVLEHLSPVERAVFLLHDVFATPFADIATAVGKSVPACRQIASRARTHIRSAPLAERMPATANRALVEQLIGALQRGDTDAVAALIAPDVVVVSDGGAETHAARRPVVGIDRVTRLLTNLAGRLSPEATVEVVEVNGSVGGVYRLTGQPVVVIELESDGALVSRIHLVTAPSKLRAAAAALDPSSNER
jgi:RNA polymerase sigma-70 factor (ECF subfamily)